MLVIDKLEKHNTKLYNKIISRDYKLMRKRINGYLLILIIMDDILNSGILAPNEIVEFESKMMNKYKINCISIYRLHTLLLIDIRGNIATDEGGQNGDKNNRTKTKNT